MPNPSEVIILMPPAAALVVAISPSYAIPLTGRTAGAATFKPSGLYQRFGFDDVA